MSPPPSELASIAAASRVRSPATAGDRTRKLSFLRHARTTPRTALPLRRDPRLDARAVTAAVADERGANLAGGAEHRQQTLRPPAGRAGTCAVQAGHVAGHGRRDGGGLRAAA